MTTCLVGFISLLGSLSCSGPDPIGPRQDTLRPAPMLAVGSAGPCARVHVQIVGGTTAQASFAADSGCATGLALVGAGAVGYVKNQRKVSIPVRVVNRGPGGRDAPILVALPRDSGVVTAPSNITARVVESNADSIGASGVPDQGAAFWTLLESGGTITGDSTPVRILQLVVPNKTTAARISFEIRAELPDSALPVIPSRLTFPEEKAYSIAPALAHDPNALYYRRLIAMWLKDGADGPQFRALTNRYQAELVGGSPLTGLIVLRVVDRGPSWSALTALLDSIRLEPIVRRASLYRNDENPPGLQARFPVDGAGLTRGAWFTSPSLWAFRAIRAPSAWGCETGGYGSSLPEVAILEEEFASSPVGDLNIAVTFRATAQVSDPGQQGRDWTADSTYAVRHSTWSSGAAAAIGNNAVGSAGMAWGAPLQRYAIGTRNARFPVSFMAALTEDIIPRMIELRPRIVSVSLRYQNSSDTTAVDQIKDALKALFTAVPDLIWFQAAGNYGEDYTLQQLQSLAIPDMGLSRALWELRTEGFSNQIVFVAGTQPGNKRWLEALPNRKSSILRGATPIAAPAFEVITLSTDGAPVLSAGTSIATPLVAGTAALLLTTDPALSAAQVVDYLERGSRVAVRDSVTGLLVPREPVQGFPEPVYQLDAYGSLQLLSQDRGDSPLCGQQVLAEPPVSFAVLRDFEVVRSTRIDHAKWLPARISVAPGGREVSAFLLQDSLNAWCTGCTGQSVATFDLLGRRIRTWKDADARFDGDGVFAIQRPSLTAYFIDRYSQASGGLLSSTLLADSTGGSAYVWPDDVHLHPQGRYLFYRGLVFDLTTGASTRFTPISTSAWDLSPDGSKLVALERTGPSEGPWDTRLTEFRVTVNPDSTITITGPHQDVFLAGESLWGPFYGEEGRVLATIVVPAVSGQCTIQLRPAAALGTVAETKYWPGTSCPDPNGLWQASERRELSVRDP